jgi:GxxExxY protein
MGELLYKAESYKVIGCCLEVHSALGKGYSEVVYKDALEHELKLQGIPFAREKGYTVQYKTVLLPHKYFADFVVFDTILLEANALAALDDSHVAQVLNYLAASRLRLGLLVNFGENSLVHRRVVL